MSAIIVARGISYVFANGRELFTDLSFSVASKLSALVGPNGVGKTHLARLLAGELEPSTGGVTRNVSVRLFSQRQEPPPMTVADFLAGDDVALLLQRQRSDRRESPDTRRSPDTRESPDTRGSRVLRSRLLDNIDPQTLCANLSGGQWTRVRLAQAASDQFLILDEPTNDLDREGRAAMLDFLRNHQPGALVVSHDRECLATCEDILELSNRGLVKFGGGWTAYTEAREHERENLNAALDVAKRERDRILLRSAEQTARQDKRNRRAAESAKRGGTPKLLLGARKRNAQKTSGKLDVATLSRSEAAIRDVRAALGNLKVDPVMYADWMGTPVPTQKLIAEAEEFNIRLGHWVYSQDLNFVWRGNVRVALRGDNGSGKSTLLKALLGLAQDPLRGAWETRGQLRRGDLTALYLDQQCSSLDDTQTVLENVRATSAASETDIRNDLARFLFARDAVFQQVSSLSGGERLRAALARGLLSTRKPELMVLDEPTNNLDLANVDFLENVVSEFRGALVVVSHDDTFLQNCGVTSELVLPQQLLP
jgi:ATPase subunit of ABC transporter with duplicated ATPase domains